MIRAARYRRVSTVGQEDNSSLQTQLDRMNEYCQLHGYETTDDALYTEVMTGVVWRDRPLLQQMLKDASEGKFQVVLIDHPDRIGRGEPIVIIMEELRYHNIRLESVQVKIEDTDEGKLLVYLQAYTSKQEWNRIRKRSRDGQIKHVTEGKQLGGIPKYGYMWDAAHEHYIPHPQERLIIERMFALAKQGMTVRQIAKILNQEGIPTRSGEQWRHYLIVHILQNENYTKDLTDPDQIQLIARIREMGQVGVSASEIVKILNAEGIPSLAPTPWRHNLICQYLRDPIYIGQGASLKTSYSRQATKRHRQLNPESERIPFSVPPLIDKETFDIVQKQIDYNKFTAVRNNKHPENALLRLGPAICGHCGGRLHATTDRNGARTNYICIKSRDKYGGCDANTSISAKILDDAVWRYTCEVIRDPKKLAESIEALKTPNPRVFGQNGIASRKKEIEEEIGNWLDMGKNAKNKSTLAKINASIAGLEEELEILEAEEKKFSTIREKWGEVQKEIKRFEYWCSQWREKLQEASYQDRRTCIDHLGITVAVYRYGHNPRYHILVSPPDMLEKLGVVSVSS